MPKRAITVDDLFNIRLVFDPQISPDGKTVAFVLTTPDLARDAYHSHIWLVPSDGSASPRQFTFGEGKDRAPRWSPDGKRLAFISDREKDKAEQLCLIAITGGEAQRLTDDANKPSAPVWSPDGTLIAYTSKVVTQDSKTANGVRDNSDVKSYTRLNYKADGEGLWDYAWRQVFVFTPLPSPDQKSGEGRGGRGSGVRQLTRGAFNHTAPTWSPDSKTLVFAANRTARADETNVTDLWAVPAQGGAIRRLTRGRGPASAPAFSPDGKWLAFVGHANEFSRVTQPGIYLLPARGGVVRKLTINFDRGYGSTIVTDLRAGEESVLAPQWSGDSSTVYFLATDGGTSNVYTATMRDLQVKQVTQGEHQVFDFSYSRAANRFALAITDALNPNDVFVARANNPRPTRVTRVNADWLASVQLAMPERFTVPRDDGWDVEAWLMKPIGWRAGKKYPVVLEIHGGPHSAYGAAFFHEFQLLCARGFAVVFTNPRGSAGYGQDFVKATYHDWGGGDYRDLMAAMDHALEKCPWLDSKQCGVAGGSYGGYMTDWIITHTHRFRAAVAMRALNNFYSFYGTSDIGHFFATDWEVGDEPWNNPEEYLAHSPIAHVAQCQTPLLILHGEKDMRCPTEQAEQFYIALKKLGVPTEFVRFPDASHNLSRNGKPKLRKERLERIVAWFARYLR
ncbi:MAG: S9 family peptidase [Chloroflexi bacterium]|nr:S9 family peptidase [Chloroflexota bacterium]